MDNVVVTSDGHVMLGPRTSVVRETPLPFLWDLALASSGDLIAATGNEGHVLRITPDGKSSLLFDAPEIEVHALAVAPDGATFVGSSPDGKVYRVGANGQSSVFFDPEDKYIWALAVAPDGTLYVGTGDKGRLYRVTAQGKGDVFYETKAVHVTALGFDSARRVLAGTASPGRLFRIEANGKGFVLLDSPFKQVQAIRPASDALYVCAMNPTAADEPTPEPAPKPAPASTRPPVPTVTTEVVVTGVGEAAPAETTEPEKKRPAATTAKGAVYRIDADGLWSTVWEAESDLPYDVVVAPDKTLLVATGTEGKVYRLEGDPVRTALVARATAREVTRLTQTTTGDVYLATSNPGKVMRMSGARATEGTYISDVRDAAAPARWGTLRWRADVPNGTRVEVSTRSGNTSTPDATWSEWSAASMASDGFAMASPPARYLQWRARLVGNSQATPVLTSVTAAYLPRNLRPEVTSITVHPPGVVFQRPFSTGDPELAGVSGDTAAQRAAAASMAAVSSPSVLGRKTYQKGLQTIAWEAQDQNDDLLVYDVFARRSGESIWAPLRRKMTETIFTWDTTSVPDGTYVVKVVASDAGANPAASGLTSVRESAPFEIDNTPPSVDIDPRAPRDGSGLGILVRDTHSPIQRVEWSSDGTIWREVFPADGIADSPAERYELKFDGTRPARVTVRATDAMANIATMGLTPAAAAAGR